MSSVENICVIDDDVLYQLLFKKTIERYGFAKTITSYHDGEEAFESLKQSIIQETALPDIILLDINMPVLDGWEFLDAFLPYLMVAKKNISIYLATSSIAASDQKKATSYPAIKKYLQKPIDFDVLAELVKQHLAAN